MKTKLTLLGGAALLAVASMGAATTVEAKESWGKGAPEFSDPDGNIKFKVRGRVMFDAVSLDQAQDDGGSLSEGFTTRLRRARIGVEGAFDSKFKYKAEVSLTPRKAADGENVEWEDLYLEYAAGFGSLVVGQQKMGAVMEAATSSRFIAQMERSFITEAFEFERNFGVGAIFGAQTNWHLATFFNTDNLNEADTTLDGETSEPTQILVHGHFAPMFEPTKVVHLGGTVRFRDSGADDSGSVADGYRYRVRSATNVGSRLATTGNAWEKDTFYGVEAATIMGPFWASGEYGFVDAKGIDSADDAEFQSFNVQAGWFLTGESRGYKAKTGEFDRTVPNAPVSEGGMGAWELRARYDYIDLTDGDGAAEFGGEATSYTIGVNWSPVKNVRFMGEYAKTEVEERDVGDDADADVIQFRASYDW